MLPRLRRIPRPLLVASAAALALGFYAVGVPGNPPGFYIDESAIAYNAHTIAQSGRDEYGDRWPLYFRSFGEYKNPTIVYLLAGVFRFSGPSIFTARLLSASLGAVAALVLGWMAWRMTHRAAAAAIITLSALLTPWLYEGSRLVFEVAAYPLVCAGFLLVVWRASQRHWWNAADIFCVATLLALLTYTYSIGRLLGPLLAVGMAWFVSRANLGRVVATWTLYGFTLIPIAVFASRHPGALTGRFSAITSLRADATLGANAAALLLQFVRDVNPWRWLVTGENNIRDHMPGMPALLMSTFVLALTGAACFASRVRRDPWSGFVIYGLVVSMLPAALTVNEFPQLRLITIPVFLHVLAIPVVNQLLEPTPWRRAALAILITLLVAQGVHFQRRFHARPAERSYVFDERFPRKILEPALAMSAASTIYLYDPPGRSGYIHALWHGALRGIAASRFQHVASRDALPAGAVVISAADDCADCRLLVRALNFILYTIPPSELWPTAPPLPCETLRAQITCPECPERLTTKEHRIVEAIVYNSGSSVWPALGEQDDHGAVRVHARWLNSDGGFVAGNVAVPLTYDMEPGDTAGLKVPLTAPSVAGSYILRLQIAQEGSDCSAATNSTAVMRTVEVVATPQTSD